MGVPFHLMGVSGGYMCRRVNQFSKCILEVRNSINANMEVFLRVCVYLSECVHGYKSVCILSAHKFASRHFCSAAISDG